MTRYMNEIKLLIAALAAGAALATAGAAAAAPAGGHGHDDPAAYDPTHEFNWTDFGYKSHTPAPLSPPFVLMLVNFAIVLALGIKLAGPGLRRFLSRRHETIKQALEEAAALRAQAQAKLDEYADKLAAAEREVDALIEGIRADAEAEKQRIVEDAEAQAAALAKEASDRIAAEIARARAALEREVVAAAVAAAQGILRAQTTGDDQNALFKAFVADIARRPGPGAEEPA